jgi:transcription factor SPN1
VRSLLAKMVSSAKADYRARKAGQPAVAKIRLLDEVRAAVDDMRLHEALLEGPARGAARDPEATLLAVFREWLRPLPGTALPSLQVREAVYGFLVRLPVTLDHLRESGIAPLLRALVSTSDGGLWWTGGLTT